MKNDFLFTSQRLGFRNWTTQDIECMSKINADPKVMEHFPSTSSYNETKAFVKRMQWLFEKVNFCYFATVELETNTFIGFIGFAIPSYEAAFMPCIDMGWRLSSDCWGKGYATEGALRCLAYGFKELKLSNIKAVAPLVNQKSIKIMEKVGMTPQLKFNHPTLKGNTELEQCVCYEISRN